METGTVVSWAKNEGDQVAEGDLLAEVETDKATMSMDSNGEGYVAKILIPAGTKNVLVGAPLVIIVEEEGSIAAFKDYKVAAAAPPPPSPAAVTPPPPPPAAPTVTPAKPAPAPSRRPTATGDRVFISPLARRVANERGIDLSMLTGTGSGVDGCFILSDLDTIAVGAAHCSSCAYTDMPLSGMRSIIAKRLTEAKQNIPHFYLTVDVQIDKVMRMREDLNKIISSQAAKDEKPSKISINDIFIKAMAHSNKCVPECNSSWMGDFIRRYDNVDVSVAVATPAGLITPIIFNADSKGLLTISQEVRALAARARENKLKPEEFQGGSITISNLGMLGVSNFSAIINPPQACILSVGTSRQVLLPHEDQGYMSATEVSVTLCCDHRVVDGAVGATWLKEFKSYIENPTRMLL